MNTALLTTYGSYHYEAATSTEVKELLRTGFTSYIGHAATARVLSDDLGILVAHHRGTFQQQPGDVVVVVKLNIVRLPEGAILDETEIRRIGYEFGLLRRTA